MDKEESGKHDQSDSFTSLLIWACNGKAHTYDVFLLISSIPQEETHLTLRYIKKGRCRRRLMNGVFWRLVGRTKSDKAHIG